MSMFLKCISKKICKLTSSILPLLGCTLFTTACFQEQKASINGVWKFEKAIFQNKEYSYQNLIESGILQKTQASSAVGPVYAFKRSSNSEIVQNDPQIYFGKLLRIKNDSFCYNEVSSCLVEYTDTKTIRLAKGMKWRHGYFVIKILKRSKDILTINFPVLSSPHLNEYLKISYKKTK